MLEQTATLSLFSAFSAATCGYSGTVTNDSAENRAMPISVGKVYAAEVRHYALQLTEFIAYSRVWGYGLPAGCRRILRSTL